MTSCPRLINGVIGKSDSMQQANTAMIEERWKELTSWRGEEYVSKEIPIFTHEHCSNCVEIYV